MEVLGFGLMFFSGRGMWRKWRNDLTVVGDCGILEKKEMPDSRRSSPRLELIKVAKVGSRLGGFIFSLFYPFGMRELL